MRKQSLVQSPLDDKEATLTFVRNLCARIEKALEEVEQICEEQLTPQPAPSSLGQSEGIGLYLYIKENEAPRQTKYPAFSQNQILAILLAEWQKMDDSQKMVYCSKIDLNQLNTSKKMKKLDKVANKLTQSIEVIHQIVSIQDDSRSHHEIIPPENKQIVPQKQIITEQTQFDRFQDGSNPRKKKIIQCEDGNIQVKSCYKSSQTPSNTVNPCIQHTEIVAHQQIIHINQNHNTQVEQQKIDNVDVPLNQNQMQAQNMVETINGSQPAQRQAIGIQGADDVQDLLQSKEHISNINPQSGSLIQVQVQDHNQNQNQSLNSYPVDMEGLSVSMQPEQTKIVSIIEEPPNQPDINIGQPTLQKIDIPLISDIKMAEVLDVQGTQSKLVQQVDDFFIQDKNVIINEETPEFPSIPEHHAQQPSDKAEQSNPESA